MRRLQSLFGSSPRGRRVALVGGVLALLVVAIVVTRAGDDDTALRTESDGTTTTIEDSTTTTEATTSSTAETTTTTGAPITTAEPPTTAPPATAPPTTAPPVTSAPPAASLDMAKVLSFAKAGVGGADPPQTYTGAHVCPASVERPSDAGDDAVRDIGGWYLTRYCDGVYRGVLSTMTDTPALQAAWIRIDLGGGGCAGTDRVVIGWHRPGPNGGTSGSGAVIATPTCDDSSWTWVDAVGFPVYNGSWLQLDFRGSAIGNPGAFDWRGYVQAVGESGAAIDVVPNDGPEHFVV